MNKNWRKIFFAQLLTVLLTQTILAAAEDLDQACETSYTIEPSAPVDNIQYTISQPAIETPAFDQFTVEPVRCQLGYKFSITPELPSGEEDAITFDDTKRTFTVQSDRLKIIPDDDDSEFEPRSGDYEINVTALTPGGAETGIGFSFTLTVESPCYDAVLNYVPTNFPDPFQYVAGITNFAQQKLDINDFTHDGPQDVCNFTFDYILTYRDGNPIDPENISFCNKCNGKIDMFMNKPESIGNYELTLKYAFKGHDVENSPYTYDFEIDIIDPCLDHASLTPQSQTNPNTYYYTGDSPAAQFTLNPFEIEPEDFCTAIVTYSCEVVSGPRTDLCTIDEAGPDLVKGVFDPVTGGYTFQDANLPGAVVPLGDYVFRITATVGSSQSTTQFTLTMAMADPCTDQVELSILGPHFIDQSYELGSPKSSQSWDMMSNLVNTNQQIDCGDILIKFYLNDGEQTPLDPAIFSDVRASESNEFTYLKTIDFSHIGVYDIVYRAYYELYPSNSIESQPFRVEILTACPQPLSITPSAPSQQYYTVTSSQLSYEVPPFVVDPDQICEMTYSARIIDTEGKELICSECFNLSDQIFTFYYDADLEISGPDFKQYTVEITGTSGSLNPTSETASFALDVTNPCKSNDFVSIQMQDLSVQSYELYEWRPDGIQWIHEPFVLHTPSDQSLCGDLTYEATFQGNPIDQDSAPMSYDSVKRTFSFYSEDYDLIGSHQFTLEAHLTEYPVTATSEKAVQSTIDITNPCLDPETLEVSNQPSIPDYIYSESQVFDFKLNPFEVFPPTCAVTYSCDSGVTGPVSFACDWSVDDNYGVFDPTTGNYRMRQTDMTAFPMGTYSMEITGTVGSKSVTQTITFNLSHPCPLAAITLLPSQIADVTYVLRDNGQSQLWDKSKVLTIDTAFDCGKAKVDFFNDDSGQTPLDASLFAVNLDQDSNKSSFQILQTQDVSKKGIYPISYRAYHEEYPDNFAENKSAFTVTVIDPCDQASFTPLVPLDLAKKITSPSQKYQLPKFSVEPSWCTIGFSYKIKGPTAFTFNDNVETFSFDQLESSQSGRYVLEITVQSGETEELFTVDLNFEPPEGETDSKKVFGPKPKWLDELEDQYVTVGTNLTYFMGPSDSSDESVKLPESIDLILLSSIRSFASFNETLSALIVDGAALTLEDVGVYTIPVEVTYLDGPLYQVIREEIQLHILKPSTSPDEEIDSNEDFVYDNDDENSQDSDGAEKTYEESNQDEKESEVDEEKSQDETEGGGDSQEEVDQNGQGGVDSNKNETKYEYSISPEQDDTKVSILENFEGIVIQELPVNVREQERPVPYIVQFTQESVLKIAWDRPMAKVDSDASEIRYAKVGIDSDLLNDYLSQTAGDRRQLGSPDYDIEIKDYAREEAWFEDPRKKEWIKMIILDALEVKLLREIDGEVFELEKEFDWDIISYAPGLLVLQLNIEDPEELGSQLFVKDYVTVTFWGNDFFVSSDGTKVKFGQTIRSNEIQRLIQHQSVEVIDEISIASAVMMTFVMFSFVGGRLLPTWMYFNSLQLIVYTPLVTTNMPSNLHYFLNNYLQLIRLNLNGIEETERDVQTQDSDSESYLTPLLMLCGYRKQPFSGNLLVILIALAIFLVFVVIFNLVAKLRKRKISIFADVCNFSLRYGYEFFLEICLSILILAATMSDQDPVAWILVLATIIAITAFIAFLASRLCINGPYVPKSYKSGTFISSYWSVRPLNESLLTQDKDMASLRQMESIATLRQIESEHNYLTPRNVGVVHNDLDLADLGLKNQSEEQGLTSPVENKQEVECNNNEDTEIGKNNIVKIDQDAPKAEQHFESLSMIGEKELFEGGCQISEQDVSSDRAKQETLIKEQACQRVRLEADARVSPYYCTLYYGLRRNHEHGASTMYPLLFVLRRIAYVIVIVFMIRGNSPFFGALTLTLTSLAMLMFSAIERQWESRMLNVQDMVNESIFYTLCLSLICFSDLLVDYKQLLILGWLLIGVVFVLIIFNTAIICYNLYTACKLLYLKYKNRAAMKKGSKLKSKGKVLPASNKTENDIVEGSESESCSNPADLESYVKAYDLQNEQSKRNIPLLMPNQIKTETPLGFQQDKSFEQNAEQITAVKKQESSHALLQPQELGFNAKQTTINIEDLVDEEFNNLNQHEIQKFKATPETMLQEGQMSRSVSQQVLSIHEKDSSPDYRFESIDNSLLEVDHEPVIRPLSSRCSVAANDNGPLTSRLQGMLDGPNQSQKKLPPPDSDPLLQSVLKNVDLGSKYFSGQQHLSVQGNSGLRHQQRNSMANMFSINPLPVNPIKDDRKKGLEDAKKRGYMSNRTKPGKNLVDNILIEEVESAGNYASNTQTKKPPLDFFNQEDPITNSLFNHDGAAATTVPASFVNATNELTQTMNENSQQSRLMKRKSGHQLINSAQRMFDQDDNGGDTLRKSKQKPTKSKQSKKKVKKVKDVYL